MFRAEYGQCVATLVRVLGDIDLVEDAVQDAFAPAPVVALHLFHAARADLLDRLGRRAEAERAFQRVADLTPNPAERAYLTRSRGTSR